MKLLAIWIALVLPISCANKTMSESQSASTQDGPSQEFGAYWYNGLAEINSYHLDQARYGEMRDGEAVLLFVTEPFSKNKHVKLDHPESNEGDCVQVMKTNFTKKFDTGIYPYSLLTSAFTPIATAGAGSSMKVNNTCQEWCGHTFAQLDERDGDYQFQQFSYFETEGDQTLNIERALLEDEIWNLIRIAPKLLPLGKVVAFPSIGYLRFSHELPQLQQAEASSVQEGTNTIYSLQYAYNQRSVSITYSTAFPHTIQGWQESYTDGRGAQAKVLTTKASLLRTIRSDYWTKNKNADLLWKEELQLKK